MTNEFIDGFKTCLETFKREWNESEHSHKRMRVTFSRFVDGIIFTFYDIEYDENDPLAVFAIPRKDWQKLLDLVPEESITFPGVTWEEFVDMEQK